MCWTLEIKTVPLEIIDYSPAVVLLYLVAVKSKFYYFS